MLCLGCNSKFSWCAEYRCVISSDNDELSSVYTPLFLACILWIDLDCDSFVWLILSRNHSSDKLIIFSILDSILHTRFSILDSREFRVLRIESRSSTRKRLSTYIWAVLYTLPLQHRANVSWQSRLETRSSILDVFANRKSSFEAQVSRFENRGSSFEFRDTQRIFRDSRKGISRKRFISLTQNNNNEQ